MSERRRLEWLTLRVDSHEVALADAVAAAARASRSEVLRRGLRCYAAEVFGAELDSAEDGLD